MDVAHHACGDVRRELTFDGDRDATQWLVAAWRNDDLKRLVFVSGEREKGVGRRLGTEVTAWPDSRDGRRNANGHAVRDASC